MSVPALPEGRLLSWYGDDYTGSAAVMEVLTFGGVDSVLFLDVPTPKQLGAFPNARAIGIAGVARSETPAWMDRHLPPIFSALADFGPALAHYKVCSTLDSSPQIGSIGHAIDLVTPILGGEWVPALIAAPPMRRYQAFGHLFAGTGDGIYRLDRHPVMSRHPVTPMHESDVARHLALQTAKPTACIGLTQLRGPDGGEEALARLLQAGPAIVTLDSVDDADLVAVGRLIWEHRGNRLLAVGSQGVEYALLAYWRSIGAIEAPPPATSAGAVPQIVAVSGSVSPTTAEQIAWSSSNGFGLVALAASRLIADPDAETARTVEAAKAELSAGRSVLVHSARGPDDPAVAEFRTAVSSSSLDFAAANALIGTCLGRVLDRLLAETFISRAVISGGDTSGHASQQLGVHALTALAPTVPGAALCTAHRTDGTPLQLALKGGQMGTSDYFGWIRDGGGPHNTMN
ncbi:MAG: four-carbon acid sugar kinase family protein [Hyphomicrobiales bacterium]|nr:MAG: four-carbon acid sugar kinase family protein [Hyphomicrobiales bacterium]